MTQNLKILGLGWVAGSLLSCIWVVPAIAQQDTLTNAEIYRLQNSVQLIPNNQSPRPARLSDILVPRDSLRTSANALADLQFNEGSIARVDENTVFRFVPGLRRYQLSNRIAMTETVFVLESGIALILTPPDSVGTQVQTPESRINVYPEGVPVAQPNPTTWMAASPFSKALSLNLGQSVPALHLSQADETPDAQPSSQLFLPPDRSTAIMVVHDPSRSQTQVFALTDGGVTVSDLAGESTVSLIGGQTVSVTNGTLSEVQEFNLESFYDSVELAEGLGPGQEGRLSQEPESVQQTLTAIRVETLAAYRRQARRFEGFAGNFLRDALSGSDSDFDGFRGESTVTLIDPQVTEGTFTVTERDGDVFEGFFVDTLGNQIPIEVDTDDRTIVIGGQTGISNDAGLSGDRGSGTVILQNGRAIRLEVFDVGDFDDLDVGDSRPGTLTQGLAPDR